MATPVSHRAKTTLPIAVTLFVIALAAPPETCVSVGPVRLSIYRVISLIVFIPCFSALFSKKVGIVRLADYSMMFHGLWSLLALIHSEGMAQGFQSGGIYFVESFGSYLLARVYVSDIHRFRAMVNVMASVVLCLLPFTLFECVTGIHLIRESARAVLGGPGLPIIEKRMGLSRAFGSFEHPILYGIFCASAMGLSAYATPSKTIFVKALRTGLLFLATFLSVSAGALAAAAAQIALMIWDRGARAIPSRWMVLLCTVVLVCCGISAGSNRSPVKVFLTYMTFNPGTGYNRLAIFDFGSASVAKYPLLGIGLGEWERPTYMSSSMDNFWLCTTVRYGVPAFAGLVGGLLFIIVPVARAKNVTPEVAACRTGWVITLVGVSLAGSTVHFWNALFALFFFLIGSGAWMLNAVEQPPSPTARPLQRGTRSAPPPIR